MSPQVFRQLTKDLEGLNALQQKEYIAKVMHFCTKRLKVQEDRYSFSFLEEVNNGKTKQHEQNR